MPARVTHAREEIILRRSGLPEKHDVIIDNGTRWRDPIVERSSKQVGQSVNLLGPDGAYFLGWLVCLLHEMQVLVSS